MQETRTKEAHQLTGSEMLLSRCGEEIHGIPVTELYACFKRWQLAEQTAREDHLKATLKDCLNEQKGSGK
jgi:hypothetical protein